MGADDSIWNFVISVGRTLNRPQQEVEPYVKTLEDNWYDSPASLIDTKPEELSALGIPLRFAKELVNSAERGGDRGGGGSSRSGGSDKGDKGKGKKGKDKGKDKGKGKGKDKDRRDGGGRCEETVDLEDCDPAFGLRGRVVGDRGSNVHHVQDQCRAEVSVDRDARFVTISANSSDDLERAVGMTIDLINTVMRDYDDWLKENDKGSRRSGGKSKDKGKGKDDRKGKGKGKDKEHRDRDRDRGRDSGDKGEFTEVLELEATSPDFRIKGKIIGDRGKNVHHIQDQSRAKIKVEETGESITITANSQEELDTAIGMTQDLVATIMSEYDEWLKENGDRSGSSQDDGGRRSERPEKGKGKGKKGKDGKGKDRSKGPGDGEFQEILELEETEPEFRMRSKIIGDGGKNVHHIQDQTKAKLYLECEDGMRLHVSAHSQEDLDKAVSMANDLIGAVLEDYDAWCEDKANGGTGESREEKSGKSSRKGKSFGKRKDKGKGKGKKGKFDDGRPSKRQRTDY